MEVVIGLDGGGTGTRAFATDLACTHAGWGAAGLSNPSHATEAEIHRHLTLAIRAALGRLNAEPAHCVSSFAGFAGVTDAPARAAMQNLVAGTGVGGQISIDHDIRIALAGGLGGQPGIALIVGTGSSCYGRTADQRTWQTGGWGALIGDEGSGYMLGRAAIAVAARMADGRETATGLQQTILGRLGVVDLGGLLRRLHQPEMPHREIAALAPLVVELATNGDPAARRILEEGARHLAEMVAANHQRLPTGPEPAVVIAGGLGSADTLYRGMIQGAIVNRLPGARITGPMLPPAMGAALLAFEQHGVPITPALVAQLQRFA